jgi:hypothetical protein
MRRIEKVERAYLTLTKPLIFRKNYTSAILTKEEKVIVFIVLYPDCTDFGPLDPKTVNN